MVMLMVVICDDTQTQALSPLVDFFYSPFPILCSVSQHSTITNLQTHLRVPVVFLPVSVRLMAVLLLFPRTVAESECSYALSGRAEFYDLEKSATFGFLNRFLWGNGSALNPHKTGTNGILVGTKLSSIHCKKCWKVLRA